MSVASGAETALFEPIVRELRFPDALPPPQCDRVFSVNCGNTTLSWALHDAKNGFVPLIKWRSRQVSRTKQQLLNSFLPKDVQLWLFGETNPADIVPRVRSQASTKRHATIYLYVVSSNDDNKREFLRLWAGLPAILYSVKAQDFAQVLQGIRLYDTVGVDRVASLAALHYLCPTSPGHLVLDGGTALTYTTVNEKKKLCGGIGLGIGMKLRATQEFLGTDVKQNDICKMIKESTQFAWMDRSNNSRQQAVKTGIMETGLMIRSIMESFMKLHPVEPSKEVSSLPVVMLCGGDSDILQAILESTIYNPIANECSFVGDMQHFASYRANEAKRYTLVKERNIIHHGIQALLDNRRKEILSEADKLRQKLLGHRIIIPFPPEGKQVWGYVMHIDNKGDQLSFKNDEFVIFTDEGSIMPLDVIHLYDALILYEREGEPKRENVSEDDKIQQLNKKKDAGEIVKEMETSCDEIRAMIEAKLAKKKAEEEAKLAKKKAEEEAIVQAKKKAEEEAKKKRNMEQLQPSTEPEPTQKKARIEQNEGADYVDRRIAKIFDGNIYYGTIKEFYPSERVIDGDVPLWHVAYDDGDSEDMDSAEILQCVELYKNNPPE